MVAAEYEAVQMYVQLAESTDNKFAMAVLKDIAEAVLKDIADEERVHAGEFLKLLHYLAPEEAKLHEKGAKEVDGILSEVQKK
jgi:rubrerythrin